MRAASHEWRDAVVTTQELEKAQQSDPTLAVFSVEDLGHAIVIARGRNRRAIFGYILARRDKPEGWRMCVQTTPRSP